MGAKLLFRTGDSAAGPSELGFIQGYVGNETFSDPQLQFSGGNDGNVHMVINDAGYVGIGTTAPVAALHVYNPTNYDVMHIENPSGRCKFGIMPTSCTSGWVEIMCQNDICICGYCF